MVSYSSQVLVARKEGGNVGWVLVKNSLARKDCHLLWLPVGRLFAPGVGARLSGRERADITYTFQRE